MEDKKSKNLLSVYKPVGLSPYDVIKKLKRDFPELARKKIAYAGRLDPLAEGVLLLLIEKGIKDTQKYLNLDKEYEAEILFGFSSDTYDILGIPEEKEKKPKGREIKEVLSGLVGDFSFPLPLFASYKIKKKPLFWWALQGRINEIQIPEKKTVIYSLDVLEEKGLESDFLKEEVLRKIKKVRGNFRQKIIREKWEEVLEKKRKETWPVLQVRVACSSGCYIRSIAHQSGKILGSGGVLLGLRRTRVGEYKIEDSRRVFP